MLDCFLDVGEVYPEKLNHSHLPQLYGILKIVRSQERDFAIHYKKHAVCSERLHSVKTRIILISEARSERLHMKYRIKNH